MRRVEPARRRAWRGNRRISSRSTAYVAYQSRGVPVAARIDGPASAAYERGRTLYFQRQGQLNLACTHCHDANWGRTLLAEKVSQGQPVDWPAYRLEWQTVGSLERRLRACYFGVRAEMPAFGSDDLVALELYLVRRAEGAAASAPACAAAEDRVSSSTPGTCSSWRMGVRR